MRRLLLALTLVAAPAFGQTQMLKASTPANVPLASIKCGDTDTSNYGKFSAAVASAEYPVYLSNEVKIHVYSEAGSTATVQLQVAPKSGGPWYTVATITDPTATAGEGWAIFRYPFVRINVSAWVAGDIHACIMGARDEKLQY